MRFPSLSTRIRLIAVLLVLVLALVSAMTFQVVRTHAAPASVIVVPNSANEVDCNGWSAKYKAVTPFQRALCTDPLAIVNGKTARAIDNGWYVGHDEPSVKFISSAPGSGNHMTYFMQLAVDPHGTPSPSASGKGVTDYAELSGAVWFGLPICDPNSFPTIGGVRNDQCTPDSDTNTTATAGSAFMELQIYPPGFGPFLDAPSCDSTHYCAALNIDSAEVIQTNGALGYNPICMEPRNFAFLQRNGIPAGPPSPQLVDVSSFTPNSQTLLMNQGDSLAVTIKDTPAGLETSIFDFNTGQSGYIVASAANGFMNTDPVTCNGSPFSFHPEYSTARQQNQVAWATLEGGVLMEDEIGHFETCASLSNPLPFSFTAADGQSFSDPAMEQTCNGPSEAGGTESGCSVTTGNCPGATTEGGAACPQPNATTPGELCEFSDAACFPAGQRPVTSNGIQEVVSWPVAGCQQNFFQNGDLDFDGTGYIPDWPDGSLHHPTPFRYYGPFDVRGQPYPSIQFETNVGGSEFNCNTATGASCTAPPISASGPTFYPYWTIGRACQWNFGSTIAGQTMNNFGGDAEYGTPDVARFGGTLTSPVLPNPQFSGVCSLNGFR